VLPDEGADGTAAEDGVIGGKVQEPQRDAEEVGKSKHSCSNAVPKN